MNSARHLASDTLLSSFWMGVRVLALVAWLWMLVPQLEVAEFGLLASFLAINAVAALLVQAGIPYLFFGERHAQEKTSDSSRDALAAIQIGSPVAAAVSALLVHSLSNGQIVAWPLLFCIAFLDIVTSAFIQMIALRGHSFGRLGVAAGLPALMVIARMSAAATALCVGSLFDAEFLQTYLVLQGAFAVVAAAAIALALRGPLKLQVGGGLPKWTTLRRSWRYALMGGSSLASSELDKPLVTQIFGLEAAGHYALAYRAASTFATPATALAASMIPRWSKMRHRPANKALLGTFMATWLATAALGVLVALLLYHAVSALPPGAFGIYPEAWPWVLSMVWLLPLIGVHQITSAALLAMGEPTARTIIDLIAYGALLVVLVLGSARPALLSVPLASIAAEGVAVATGTIVIMTTLIGGWKKEDIHE